MQILLPVKKLVEFNAADSEKVTLSELGDDGAVVFGHMPYHKAKPRPRLPHRSSHERGHSRGGSSSGETAVGRASDSGFGSLDYFVASPLTTLNGSMENVISYDAGMEKGLSRWWGKRWLQKKKRACGGEGLIFDCRHVCGVWVFGWMDD